MNRSISIFPSTVSAGHRRAFIFLLSCRVLSLVVRDDFFSFPSFLVQELYSPFFFPPSPQRGGGCWMTAALFSRFSLSLSLLPGLGKRKIFHLQVPLPSDRALILFLFFFSLSAVHVPVGVATGRVLFPSPFFFSFLEAPIGDGMETPHSYQISFFYLRRLSFPLFPSFQSRTDPAALSSPLPFFSLFGCVSKVTAIVAHPASPPPSCVGSPSFFSFSPVPDVEREILEVFLSLLFFDEETVRMGRADWRRCSFRKFFFDPLLPLANGGRGLEPFLFSPPPPLYVAWHAGIHSASSIPVFPPKATYPSFLFSLSVISTPR